MANFMSNFMPGEWDLMNKTPDIAPTDDATAQLMLKRRLAQADLLKGMEAPQGQMVSGHYVAPSWTQYLANAVNKYQGRQQEREAIKGYQDYLGQQKKTRQDALAAAIKKLGPQDITEQTTYDIQVPNGKQAGSTDNLGGMQPYESGMKTISVPMTKVTGTRQPSYEDALAALSGYATATNQPDLAEKLMMNKATSLMTPDKYNIHNVGDTGYVVNERTGKPTGEKLMGTPKSTDYGVNANSTAQGLFGRDFNQLSQSEKLKVVDKMNEWKAAQAGIAGAKAAYETTPVDTTYPTPKPNMPKIGQEVDGHVYIGGNPNDQKSWRKK